MISDSEREFLLYKIFLRISDFDDEAEIFFAIIFFSIGDFQLMMMMMKLQLPYFSIA